MRPPNRDASDNPISIQPDMSQIRRVRKHSGRSGPLLPCVCFCLLALHWILVGALGIYFLRPRPYTQWDVYVGAGFVAMALFYLWVAYAVRKRRKYIFNIAVTCAGFWLLGFPTGTVIAAYLISNLISARHAFTR